MHFLKLLPGLPAGLLTLTIECEATKQSASILLMNLSSHFINHTLNIIKLMFINYYTRDHCSIVSETIDFIDYVTGIGNGAFRASGPCCVQNAFCLTPGFQV